jgi:hypothetical protein
MSFKPWPRNRAVLFVVLAAAACSDPVDPAKQVSQLEISPKQARLYSVGQQVTFTSTITTEAGTAGEGIEVGYKSRNDALIQVNSSGVATAKAKGGSTWIVATAGGKADSAFVDLPATPCGSVSATTIAAGQVVTDIGATGVCVAASAGEYAVIVHNNTLSGTGSSAVEVTAVGVDVPPTSEASFSKAAARSLFGQELRTWRRDVAAEMRQRRAEAMLGASFPASARTWYEARRNRASLAATVPAVGDQVSINVNISGANGCAAATPVAHFVAAVSNKAIVLADSRNPSGGYTNAEYNEFAQMFDSIINPLDVTQFGAPTDLDANQRVLLVFTRAINERTPAGADFYVGGLTHSRDLLPKSNCAGSNEAEMFYLLVPDPNGTVNNNVFSKSFVTSVTDATVAHEYQHLINFARRKYLNAATAQPDEEVWLNEGLSHLAEELLYYRRTGRGPRANVNASEIFASDASFNIFANYMAGDFLNYDEYVFRTAETSPFEPNDDLAVRGATWAFLRYVADQSFSTDGTFWFNLVNSGETGITNLRNRLGLTQAGLLAMLRDFTTSVYTDDYVTGVAAKYKQLSWDMRSVYPRLQQPFLWPMAVTRLFDTEQRTASIQAGGFKVFRFRSMAGAEAFVRAAGPLSTALPAGVIMTVVRTQ